MTPARIPLKIACGQAERLKVAVINQGDEPVDLVPLVMAVEEEGGRVGFRESEECGWITVEGESIHLAVSETRPVDFHVSVPDSACPGMRRFALAFVKPLSEDHGIGITPGIAVLVEMEVLTGGAAAAPSGGYRPLWALMGAALAALALLFLILLRRQRRSPGSPDREEGREVVP